MVSLALAVIGCRSDSKGSDPSDGVTAQLSSIDPGRSQSRSSKSADGDTITVRAIETVSSSTFSAWTSRPDVHLRCSPTYRVIPGKIDEQIIDGFSSMLSLEQIPVRLVFNLGLQPLEIPIQDGLSQVIAYGPGSTLTMTSSGIYKSKQSCGRLTATRTGSEAEETFFSTWRSRDSIGVSFHEPDGSWVWGGVAAQSFAVLPGDQSPDRSQVEDAEVAGARLFQSDAKWLLSIDGNSRVVLNQLLPVGGWELRHSNLVYGNYPFVVEYTCNPYEKSNDFCGFPSQDGTLIADPPSPARIHFAMKVSSSGDSLVVKPVWEENAGAYVLSHFTDLEIGGNIKLSISRHSTQ